MPESTPRGAWNARRRPLLALLAAAAAALALPAAHGDWRSLLDSARESLSGSPAAGDRLGNDEIVAGLKEALAQGAEKAIGALGRRDGYLGNDAVRIPLPESLRPLESGLRAVGQGRYADEFVTTMNRAAESAVPQAGAIVGDAIRGMTVAEGRRILDGPDDAATQYFRKVGEGRLRERMTPIVAETTARAGVTKAYKDLLGHAGFAASLLGADTLDVDRYVTDKALDGLFLLIAEEERRIRRDPVARGTELLRKVFGTAR